MEMKNDKKYAVISHVRHAALGSIIYSPYIYEDIEQAQKHMAIIVIHSVFKKSTRYPASSFISDHANMFSRVNEEGITVLNELSKEVKAHLPGIALSVNNRDDRIRIYLEDVQGDDYSFGLDIESVSDDLTSN